VQLSAPVDGFRLAYERGGRGPAVLLLHGWPGDRTDYREVVPLLSTTMDVVVPDLHPRVDSTVEAVSRGRCLGDDVRCRTPPKHAAAVRAELRRSRGIRLR
jgi:pimeloyl-ACP methyl ester carboxylesterase